MNIVEERRLSRRKIKPYLQLDDLDEEDDDERDSDDYTSSEYEYDSDEYSGEEEEESLENTIVDHGTGELNRGTLEIWTLHRTSPICRRKRIRKIKRYDRERVLYDESLLQEDEEGIESEDSNTNMSINETKLEINVNKQNTNMKLEKDQHNRSLSEYEEVFDTVVETQIETIEEQGPVETVVFNEVFINSILESIEVEEHGKLSSEGEIIIPSPSPRQMSRTISSTSSNGFLSPLPDGFHFTANTTSPTVKNDVVDGYTISTTNVVDFDEYVVIDIINNNIKCRDRTSTSLFVYMN